MDQCAIFVDAGYLFAQGGVAVTGSKKQRSELVLDAPAAIECLKSFVQKKTPNCRLLRIYWYDGAIGGFRPTSDQALIASLDDVKLRLGFINSQGQQKGVDSLIVTDLIELARLKSIADAVLLSGDEDVRIGVQIAQSHGVRVHLLGIEPSRASQSNQLLQEADTTSELGAEAIATFLGMREPASAPPTLEAKDTASLEHSDAEITFGQLEFAVASFVKSLTDTDIQGIVAYWETARGVPADLDKKLLPVCGKAIGRKLERGEIHRMRATFQQNVRKRIGDVKDD